MTHPANPQQLLLVKSLFQEAQQAAFKDDAFSTSKAILFLDLAIEQLLITIITSLPATVTKIPGGELKWDKLWEAAEGVMQEHGHALPNKIALRNSHLDRNRVQHGGSGFSFTHAQKCVPPAEDTISRVFSDVFGFKLERYNLLELIANEELRRWLKESEDFLSAGKPEVCIGACGGAHSLVVSAVREHTKEGYHMGHVIPRLRGLDDMDYSQLVGAFETLQERLEEEIFSIDEELVAIGVGLPVMETRRFRRFATIVPTNFYPDGHLSLFMGHGNSRGENLSDVGAFMLDYLSRLIRLVENGYPEALAKVRMPKPLSEQDF